jgi:tRNA(Ile)-lysidine synthase
MIDRERIRTEDPHHPLGSMKTTTLIQKVRETVRDYRMIDRGDRVLVAVSGGPDSLALLHILHVLSDEFGCDLHVAHLEHGLRGSDSREDAEFVGRVAGGMNLPFTYRSAGERLRDRPKDVSLEEAARELRYRFLEETAGERGASRIATGHTMDDQAETVLMRMLQGAGPGGLSGIRPVRDGRVIRPLIRCTAGEIVSYLGAVGLTPREDPSNQDTALLRNRIRHRLLPILKGEFNPSVVPALARIAAVEGEVDHALRAMAQTALERTASGSAGKIRLALDLFGDYDVALQLYILRAAIEEALGRLTDISFEHVRSLLHMARRGETPSKRITLPGSLVAYRESGDLVLAKADSLDVPPSRVIEIPGKTALPGFDLEIQATLHPPSGIERLDAGSSLEACFDWNCLHAPLVVRGWLPGDRFRPLGMSGRKKIHDFFVDEKIPRPARNRVPLLVDQKGIHWVIGHRTSEASRVTHETRRVLLLEASPLTA